MHPQVCGQSWCLGTLERKLGQRGVAAPQHRYLQQCVQYDADAINETLKCAAGDVAKVTHSWQCLNEDGQEVPCCTWAPDGWVPPYMSLASVMLLWTVFLFGQFRIFAISGTVAQWWVPGEA